MSARAPSTAPKKTMPQPDCAPSGDSMDNSLQDSLLARHAQRGLRWRVGDDKQRRSLLAASIAVGALALMFSQVGWAAPDEQAAASSTSGGLMLVAILLGAMSLGLPLFVIIGVLAMACYALFASDFNGLDTYVELPREIARLVGKQELLAIPFFVASGAIMSAGSIAKRLVAFARALVGWMPGGLAVATVGGCMFFAAISGSSPVTVIAIGGMMYPALLKEGYDRKFTLGVITSAGSLGILIPPSIPMLVYSIVAGGKRPLNAAELFLAGVLPGALIGGMLILYSMATSWKMPRDPFSVANVVLRFKEGFWALCLPVLIMVGIYGGVFTPTEAAAVSVVYALAVELLIHRDITVKDLPGVIAEASVAMGTILVIMCFAVFLNLFLVEQEVPVKAVRLIRDMHLDAVTFLIIVNIFLLIIGALMDSISAILIIAPLLAPIGLQLGIDPVHLGVIFIVNLEIGYLTPPIGINLFVASSVFRRPVGEVIRGVAPFIAVMLVGLSIVTYVPTLSLGLVNVWLRDKPFFEGATLVTPELVEGGEGGGAEGADGEPVKAPEGYVGPTGERVLSVEEMMQAATDDGGLGEDDEDEDD